MNKIIAKDIKKSFDSLPVLRGIDLAVGEGEVVAIIGRPAAARAPCCAA